MIADEIIKTALLGTDKYMPAAADGLEQLADKIVAQQKGKEDRFLKLAITTLLYEEAGKLPQPIEATMPVCPPETKTLVLDKLAGLINMSLSAGDDTLFTYFIYLANRKAEVLSPELVPLVLNKALEHKKTAAPLIAVCGETGRWLCGLNEQWTVLYPAGNDDEDVWQTGSLESRKAYLSELRSKDAVAAVQLLAASINDENVANKVAFTELLRQGLSIQDEPLLTSLLTDKSQKVKDIATDLLRRIQGSGINNNYLEAVLQAVSVKEERHLLIMKKNVLSIDEGFVPGEELYKTGIEKVSKDKGVNDNIFVLGQLLAFINPEVLAGRLGVTTDALLGLFFQHKDNLVLSPFLAKAALLYRHKGWATRLLQDRPGNIYLLDVLPPQERGQYYEQFIEQGIAALLEYILDDSYTVIYPPLAEKILEYLFRNPYSITQPVYQRLALQLPVEVMTILGTYSNDYRDEYQIRYFRTQATEMMRIIELKNTVQ